MKWLALLIPIYDASLLICNFAAGSFELMQEEDIQIESLTSAVSRQHEQSNKRWAIVAALSFVGLMSDTSQNQQIFGILIVSDIFPEILAFLIALANLSYLVAHSAAYDAHKTLQTLCIAREWRNKEIAEGVTYQRYVFAMITSNIDRIWPIFQTTGEQPVFHFLYRLTKSITDTSRLWFAPIAGLFLLHQNQSWVIMTWIAAVVTALSVIATVIFSYRVLKYNWT